VDLTIKQAAEYLNVSIDTLRRWETRGKLVPTRIGGRRDRHYKIKELDNLLAERQSTVTVPIDQIRSLSTRYLDQTIEFLRELIQTPSVNGVHPEKDIAELIVSQAKQLDLPAFTIWKNRERPNVFVGNSFSEKDSFLYVAHLDTVTQGDEAKWTSSPFQATIRENRLYGRGAADCKAGIAMSIFALKILKDLDLLSLAKFVGGSDEEAGAQSDIGLPFVIEKGLRANAAIYTYPGYNTISLGHRGLIRQIITCKGEQVHTGLSEWANKTKGKNAIEGIVRFINEIEKIPLNATHKKFTIVKSTQTVTLINGGVGESIVPDHASIMLDTRLLPTINHERYLQRIRKICTDLQKKHGFQYEILIKNNGAASLISEREPVVKILDKLAHELFSVEPAHKGRGPFNESGLLNAHGIPTVGGFGVRGENVHGIDEYIELADIPKILEIYVQTAIEIHNKRIAV
jgi:excisionase family DNA binding protein